MKVRPFHLFMLVHIALAAFPIFAMAAPTTSPYYTDTVKSYVQDQVSKDMEELNTFLCLLSAMAPDHMVNKGDYIAMIDLKACQSGTNTGVNYLFPTVNASRESNLKAMLTKIWIDDIGDNNNNQKYNVRMNASASQAPATKTPYGVFRLDYCKQYSTDPNNLTNCSDHIGYIDASRSGLSFYSKNNKYDTANGFYYDEFALQLGTNSTTSNGSGIIIKTNNNNTTGNPVTSAVVFANNADYFYRDDGTRLPDGSANQQCFARAESKAKESVWRYGLYNETTGERINRLSGFQIQYSTGGQTYYGYADKWGFSMPVDVPDAAPVTRQSNNASYTVKRTGGKLTKYTQAFKKLSDFNGPSKRFQFYPYQDVYDTAGTTGNKVMSAFNSYLIYWDTNKFYVHSVMDQTTYTWTTLAIPLAADNTSMQGSMIYYDTYYATYTPYDLYAWSEFTGSISIKKAALAALTSTGADTIVFTTTTTDAVNPTSFSAIGGLVCITDCLTKTSIDTWVANLGVGNQTARPSVDYSTYPYPTYAYQYTGTAASGSLTNATFGTFNVNQMSYTLNDTTGNIEDSTGPVIQNNPTYWGTWGNGRMVSTSNWQKIILKKCISGTCSATTLSDSDIDLLANLTDSPSGSYSYYYWQTGPSMWDQLVYLLDNTSQPVVFESPLELTYTVPDAAKYGGYRNQPINLSYNEFGNLSGIPSYCVDMRNNDLAPCSESTWSNYEFYRWVPQFSIPFDATLGVAAVTGPPGDPLIGTHPLVKGLDKELRLQKVDLNICTVQQLGTNVTLSKLPSDTQWIDPSTIGSKPTFNPIPAPKVIDGVVQ